MIFYTVFPGKYSNGETFSVADAGESNIFLTANVFHGFLQFFFKGFGLSVSNTFEPSSHTRVTSSMQHKIALKLDTLKSEKSRELMTGHDMSKKIIPSSPEEREVEYENLEIFGFGISSFKYLLLSDLKSTKYAKQTEIRLLENNIGNLDGMRQ